MNILLKPSCILRSILFCGIFFTVFGSACVQSEPISTSTPLISAQGTRTEIPYEDLIPTQPQSTPETKPMLAWTSTVTLAENTSLEVNCVEIVDDSQGLETFPGVLAIQDGLLNLKTFQLLPFRESIFFGELVSPNGSQIALKYEDSGDLLILNSKGFVLQKITLPSLIPIYWLDNSTLVIQEEITDYPLHVPLPSYILDLKTGKISQVPFDLELIHKIWNGLGWKWKRSEFTKTSISPNQKHLVFASDSDLHFAMVLWDLQTNQEITQIFSSPEASLPRWNRNGTSFLVSLPPEYMNDKNKIHSNIGYELYDVFTDGRVEKISAMSEVDPSSQYDFVWSPDDKYVAFRLEYISERGTGPTGLQEAHLAFLDVETGKVEDLCILASDSPVWSPSGNFLAIRHVEGEGQIYIIDIDEHKAYLIYGSPDVKIIGWMIE